MSASEPRSLIIETSGKTGVVALAQGRQLKGVRRLDETRRHARDLAPAVAELLKAQGWKPADVQAVLVSRGPGSYTGLRVGIMSAKAFAYATGCRVIGVDTTAAIALQLPEEAEQAYVLIDAQQDRVYVQGFQRQVGEPSARRFSPATPLQIVRFADWSAAIERTAWVTGPGLRGRRDRLPEGIPVAEPERWDPRPESVLELGLARNGPGEGDDVWGLEPLYLRPSSAEEQWAARGARRNG